MFGNRKSPVISRIIRNLCIVSNLIKYSMFILNENGGDKASISFIKNIFVHHTKHSSCMDDNMTQNKLVTRQKCYCLVTVYHTVGHFFSFKNILYFNKYNILRLETRVDYSKLETSK